MKNKKIIIAVFIAMFLLIPVYISEDIEDGCTPEINLPTDSVTMCLELFPSPEYEATFKTELEGIYGLFDVMNGTYLGWCVEYGVGNPTCIDVILNSSYNPPDHLIHENWSKINYILNNKEGDWTDVQRAMWYFINYGPWDWDKNWGPFSGVSTEAWSMIDNATLHGDDFCPECGDVIAVICDQGVDRERQLTIIEVPMPCYGGATPGFWKNKGAKVGWPSPYETSDTLLKAGFVLPVDPMNDNSKRPVNWDDSLLVALNYKGGDGVSGMAQTLLRAAVAALLNAAEVNITYPLTEVEVLEQVNATLATEDRTIMEDLKDELDYYNNLGFDEWW